MDTVNGADAQADRYGTSFRWKSDGGLIETTARPGTRAGLASRPHPTNKIHNSSIETQIHTLLMNYNEQNSNPDPHIN